MNVRLSGEFSYDQIRTMFQRLYPGKIDFSIFDGVKNVDLVVFSGGADIDPRFYGEENTHSGCNLIRDYLDYNNWIQAVDAGIPCFGICRGHQFLNAMNGGKLLQHIEDYHDYFHLLDNGKMVTSTHHQGVIKTPLEILATHKGIIEMTKGEKVFSVQFHPEFGCNQEMDEMVKEGLIW